MMWFRLKMDKLQQEGGKKAELADIASSLDGVVVVVLNAAQTESVLFGETGIVPLLRKGVGGDGMCDSRPGLCPQYGISLCRAWRTLCRCPDFGWVGGKRPKVSFSIMTSATPEAYAAAEPLLEATAETIFRLGDCAGAGSAMKAVNQLLAGVHIAVMGEALTFGVTQALIRQPLFEVISKCAGTSWMLENRAPHIVEGDYTPHSAVDIWLKDLGIVLDIAKGAKFAAPITAAALQQYVAASGCGLGREDDSAVAKIYARNAGVNLPGMS